MKLRQTRGNDKPQYTSRLGTFALMCPNAPVKSELRNYGLRSADPQVIVVAPINYYDAITS
jgi:hypothetical protein